MNWKELKTLVEKWDARRAQGERVDRVVVPDRPEFSAGFLKDEFCIRIAGRKAEHYLLMNLRVQNPYVIFASGKGPRASTQATKSPFLQELTKVLEQAELESIENILQERAIIFWWKRANKNTRLGMLLSLIPAHPELILFERESDEPLQWNEKISVLLRSRKRGENSFTIPDGSRAPKELEIKNLWSVASIEEALQKESIAARQSLASNEFETQVKDAKKKIAQASQALLRAKKEPEWQKWGELLKSLPPDTKVGKSKAIDIPDFETGESVSVTVDPRLSLHEQMQAFFQKARQKKNRISQTQDRLQEAERQLEKYSQKLNALGTHAGKDVLEKILSRSHESEKPTAPTWKGWKGKVFLSENDLPILVGRNKKENLELTFKVARGNDLWFHVRGKPGSHAVIPLRDKKNAPLESLLDAACLVIYYSGGESWGKTEVDYVQRKNVKKIKDSDQVSYTQNKTLMTEVEPERLARLLAEK